MKNQIFKCGDQLPFTAEEAITSGDLIAVGNFVGVATGDIANGEEGILALEGVFEVPKATGAIAQGDVLYYDAATKKVTTTAASNKVAGYAWSSATSAATTVDLRLLF